jgi:hypothetical protein
MAVCIKLLTKFRHNQSKMGDPARISIPSAQGGPAAVAPSSPKRAWHCPIECQSGAALRVEPGQIGQERLA